MKDSYPFMPIGSSTSGAHALGSVTDIGQSEVDDGVDARISLAPRHSSDNTRRALGHGTSSSLRRDIEASEVRIFQGATSSEANRQRALVKFNVIFC